MDVFDRMLELAREGYDCAQIMLTLALDMDGKSDPDLVRAMGGLSLGVAGGGDICGALSGGACLLAYFAGRGAPGEQPHPKLGEMYASLREWFSEYTAGSASGSANTPPATAAAAAAAYSPGTSATASCAAPLSSRPSLKSAAACWR